FPVRKWSRWLNCPLARPAASVDGPNWVSAGPASPRLIHRMPRIERPEVMREPLGHKYWRHRDFEGLWGILEGKRTIWKTARCFITLLRHALGRRIGRLEDPGMASLLPTAIGAVSCPRRSDEHDDRHVVATGEVSDGH